MKTTLDYFREICEIPHGSYNIDSISDYLVDFAKARNLFYIQDELKNVIIKKPASEGYENEPGIILQGHMDMVAVKTADCKKDLATEGLDLVEEDGYLYAKNTSLGGDDGIAVAIALHILDDDSIMHPSLECIFTVNEEVGMDGAVGIDMSVIDGRKLINIDSEEEGVITVSCAGGVRVCPYLKIKKAPVKGDVYSVKITGLLGGHSGTSIHLGRANANILAGRLLYEIRSLSDIKIISIEGGEKDNAIANYAYITFSTNADNAELEECIKKFNSKVLNEYRGKDDGIKVTLEQLEKRLDKESDSPNYLFRECIDNTDSIIDALIAVPDGVIKMCDYTDMVETSLNLGVMRIEDDKLALDFCVRSSVSADKESLKNRVADAVKECGFVVECKGDYPAWEYNDKSTLTKQIVDCYERLYGEKPVVTGVHAGLECGILRDKIKDLDCVSIGPNILNIHTVKERLDLASCERTEKLVLEVLKNKNK
ncbi:MAG: aminoacyl-histidine dipeptidase [Lachnospiraceae bacterium]|nr:aminoacyl-histidine dipeptidase [Lachnospiraceae bacterium]